MTVKELENKYQVFKRNGKYHIYDPERLSGKRSVYKYLCSATKKGASFFVDGFKPTTKIENLASQVNEKVSSYKYDSEYYDPNYIDGLFEYFVIYDYMSELGFKSEGNEFYILDRKSVYKYQTTDIKISLYGLDPNGSTFRREEGLSKEVDVVLHTGGWSWASTKVKRDVEEIKKGIDSMLKPLFLTEGVANVITSEKMENFEDFDIVLKQFSLVAGTKSKDIKGQLKERLLEMADKL